MNYLPELNVWAFFCLVLGNLAYPTNSIVISEVCVKFIPHKGNLYTSLLSLN
jgi:hypothetical protein